MANAGTFYNLDHVQIAVIQTTPTWIDLPYAVTLDPTISQDTDPLKADASTVVTSYSAPEGTFSLEWARAETVTLAILAGLTASTSGTTPSTIDRLDYLGNTTPPGVHLSAWAKNVDANVTGAGLRLNLPNAKASVPSIPLGQETYSTLSSDGVFNADENGVMMTLEFLETAPVFTSKVMPVNLAPPA
jgi:hypothetical protein